MARRSSIFRPREYAEQLADEAGGSVKAHRSEARPGGPLRHLLSFDDEEEDEDEFSNSED